MSKVIIGPTGIGPAKDAVRNLERYKQLGFEAAEVLFTYKVYLNKNEAKLIGESAKRLGIKLSIHAPYYVNLNSKEKEKLEASKERILKSCEIGHCLGAKRIVIHPGFYSDMKSEDAREIIKNGIIELMEKIKDNKWDVELCIELMGKKNVFGSIEEVSWLAKETGCSFCIDFAHVLARYDSYMFEDVKKAFPQKSWQCHFSGIVYGEKGEKNHIPTPTEEWKKLLDFFKTLDKDGVIICESPSPVKDCVEGIEIAREIGLK